MVPFYLLIFAAAVENGVFCLQGSCGREQEPASPEGAGGCGCDKLRRAPAEGRTGSDHPAVRYSTAAYEEEIRGVKGEDEKELQSQV